MAGNNNYTATPRKKIALDNGRLSLRSMDMNADGKPASMTFGFLSNRARITVWTNDEATKGSKQGRIECSMELPEYFLAMALIAEAAAAPGEFKKEMQFHDFTFYNRERSKEPQLIATFFAGKSKDGIVWISITTKESPRLRFAFGPSDKNVFKNADGTPVDPGWISVKYAEAHVMLMRDLYATLAVIEYQEPKPKAPSGNGGGGNYQNNSSNYGGGGNQNQGSNNYATVDDDIPF